MATSGTTVWQSTRDELIAAALRKLTVIAEGETPSTEQLSAGQEAANGILSAYQALGMFLWKRKTQSIPLVAGQSDYVIGVGSPVNTSYPYKLIQAVISYGGQTNVNMEIESDYDFNQLPPDSSGSPIKVTYQPLNGTGVLRVWPTPSSASAANDELTITYQQRFDVYTAGSETMDLPQEWYLPLVYGIADILGDEFGLPLEDRRRIERQSEKYLSMVLSGGSEDTSTYFYPDRRN